MGIWQMFEWDTLVVVFLPNSVQYNIMFAPMLALRLLFRPMLELGCRHPRIGTGQLRVVLRFRVRFAVPEWGAQF